MTVRIWDDELIVGNHASRRRAGPVFPEWGVYWLERQLDEIETRPQDRMAVPGKVKEDLCSIFPYWRGKTHQDRVAATLAATWPPELLPALDLETFHFNQVIRSVSTNQGDGHATPSYDRLLRLGLRSVLVEAQAYNAALDLSRPESIGKRLFYQAVEISCAAAIAFAQRYADLALRLAKEAEPERRAELEEVARICRRVRSLLDSCGVDYEVG